MRCADRGSGLSPAPASSSVPPVRPPVANLSTGYPGELPRTLMRMEGSVGAPPQRVCPKCARISWATGPQCPYCNARFRRAQGVAPGMLVATAVAVIVVVAIMLVIAGNQLDNELTDKVDQVNKQMDAN